MKVEIEAKKKLDRKTDMAMAIKTTVKIHNNKKGHGLRYIVPSKQSGTNEFAYP